jgi:hypothetical protein
MDNLEFDGTELDFWLGDWSCIWTGGTGTNRLSWILDDRVILEEFQEIPAPGETALHGRSWSVFDPNRKLWRQTWVDNQGGYFDLVGGIAEGSFAFMRAAPERGSGARQRMVFRDIENDRFRWTWESSLDAGATWVTRWEIAYAGR